MLIKEKKPFFREVKLWCNRSQQHGYSFTIFNTGHRDFKRNSFYLELWISLIFLLFFFFKSKPYFLSQFLKQIMNKSNVTKTKSFRVRISHFNYPPTTNGIFIGKNCTNYTIYMVYLIE